MSAEQNKAIEKVASVLAGQIGNVIVRHGVSRDCKRTSTVTAIAIVLAGLVRLFSDERVIADAAAAAREMVDAANAGRRLN